jgi:hypothetical protein
MDRHLRRLIVQRIRKEELERERRLRSIPAEAAKMIAKARLRKPRRIK